MNLRKYLPQIYNDNAEMNAIMVSEDKELIELKAYIRKSFNDNFIKTATETGVANYENILNIIPDLTTEDLQFRKERVLNRLISHIPFTERYLQAKLDIIIGRNTNSDFTPYNQDNTNWYYIINYNNYTLDIYITQPGRSWLRELEYFCENTIPCNIDWHIHVFHATWKAVKEYYDTWGDVNDDNATWQDVLDGSWLS